MEKEELTKKKKKALQVSTMNELTNTNKDNLRHFLKEASESKELREMPEVSFLVASRYFKAFAERTELDLTTIAADVDNVQHIVEVKHLIDKFDLVKVDEGVCNCLDFWLGNAIVDKLESYTVPPVEMLTADKKTGSSPNSNVTEGDAGCLRVK